jgi:hypothetical protein
MLCENCQTSPATVHLTGWQTIKADEGGESRRLVEHHFCEKCASVLKQTEPLLNPLLSLGSSARALTLRVVNISTNVVEVVVIRGAQGDGEERFRFRRAEFPEQYAIQDLEFELFSTTEELDRLQFKD